MPGVSRAFVCGAVGATDDFLTTRMVSLFDFLGPFSLIVFFLIGIVIGLTIFPLKWLKANSWLQTIGISLTLFSMGASMAGSPTFLEDLRTAGVQALLFAAATIAGSVLLVYILSRVVFRRTRKGETEK